MSENVLGIDVSKKSLAVALIFNGKTLKKSFSNTPSGHRLLDGWLRSLRIEYVHACLEATGTYSEAIAEFLHKHGHIVSMVNPLRIKGYAQSDLKRNKTDPADAVTIADFCLKKRPEPWQPLSDEAKQLQALTRRIDALGTMLISEQNRLESAPREIRQSLKRVIRTLEKEIERLKQQIKDHIDNNPKLREQSDLLCSIPGIGQKTAAVLLAELEFAAYPSARALAAQAGVNPRLFRSGTSLYRTKLSKLGNSRIRKALYFPAISAIKYNQIVRNFASRLSQSGKKPMQVICASMRKLLHLAFGVIKHHRPFDPNLAF